MIAMIFVFRSSKYFQGHKKFTDINFKIKKKKTYIKVSKKHRNAHS